MKKIYIAGPYSAFKADGSWDNDKVTDHIYNALKYAIILSEAGIGFFCPHTHTSMFQNLSNATEEFYKELDMSFVDDCRAILAIEGWTTSKGAYAEVDKMRLQGKPVFTYDMKDWLEQIKRWYFGSENTKGKT